MHPLSAAILMDVWEDGGVLTPVGRALRLLAAACPLESPDTLARLPIGERDDRLLTLRSWTFGELLDCVVSCPSCGDRLEMQVPVAGLRAVPQLRLEQPDQDEGSVLSISRSGYQILARVPTSDDLADAAGSGDGERGPLGLFSRCIVEARRDGEPVSADTLPEEILAAVSARLEVADPQAHVEIDLTCPACGHRWQSPFDIVSFFWAEIDDWARRTLRDVHALASSYGWREADILSMSTLRRQAYLNLIYG